MEVLAHTHQTNSWWQRLTPFMVIAMLVLIYLPTFKSLSGEWVQWDQSLSHAYPLLLWFLVLIYKASPLPVSNQGRVLNIILGTAIVGMSLLWLLFHIIQIKILEQMLLLPLLLAAMAFVFGFSSTWHLRFLFLIPLFVLPIWDYLNPYLVELASLVVGEMVRMIAIPALIDGSSIFIPSGHIMIADGCSGLRYLIISLALGYTISYLNGYKEAGLLLSLVLAGSLGLLANWIRIFILILVGYYTEMESSLMEDHETLGWIVFAFVCFPAIYFAPVIKKIQVIDPAANYRASGKKFAALALLLMPGLVLTQAISTAPSQTPPAYEIDANQFSLSVTALPITLSLPASTIKLQYKSADNIHLQINQYIPQTAADRLVPYLAHQFDPQYWVIERQQVLQAGDKTMRAEQFRQKSGMRKLIQVQWFDVGGYKAESVLKAKLLQIPAVLSGKKYFTIVTLQTECGPLNCEQELLSLMRTSASIQ